MKKRLIVCLVLIVSLTCSIASYGENSSDTVLCSEDVMLFQSEFSSDVIKVNHLGESSPLIPSTSTGTTKIFELSPDNSHVALAVEGENPGIYILSVATSSQEAVFNEDKEQVRQIQWINNSRFIYTTERSVYLTDMETGEKYTVVEFDDPGQPAWISMETSISLDKGFVAVTYIEHDDSDHIPVASALYIYNILNKTLLMVDSVSGEEGNSFFYQWSPFNNKLLYQRRKKVAPMTASLPTNHAAGSLSLHDAENSSQSLIRSDSQNSGDLNIWTWLKDDRILMAGKRAEMLEVRDTEGNLLVSSGYLAQYSVSPDKEYIVYMDPVSSSSSLTTISLMNLATGEKSQLGKACDVYLSVGMFHTSEVISWNPDSRHVVWTETVSSETEGEQDKKLFINNLTTGNTRLISDSLHQGCFDVLDWSPSGSFLSFYKNDNNKLNLSLFNLNNHEISTVGEAGTTSDSSFCPDEMGQLKWLNDRLIAWNKAGKGLFLTDTHAISQTVQLYPAEADNWFLDNGRYAFFRPVNPDVEHSFDNNLPWLMVDTHAGSIIQSVENSNEMGYQGGIFLQCEAPCDLPAGPTSVSLTTQSEMDSAPVQISDTSGAMVFSCSLPEYCLPVDIYFAYINPEGVIYFPNSSGELVNDFNPYQTSTTGGFSTNFSYSSDLSFPRGLWQVYWLLQPSGGDWSAYELGQYSVNVE